MTTEAAPKPASRPPIEVADDFGFDLSHFSIPEHYRPDLANVMLPHGLISDRAQRMAEDIYSDYDFANGARLHMLCVLKGGHEFFSATDSTEWSDTNRLAANRPDGMDGWYVCYNNNTVTDAQVTAKVHCIDAP